jgi:hypothetical protein
MTLPAKVLAGLHQEACTCEGKKASCSYCGGSGVVYSNMTPEQKVEHEAWVHSNFIRRDDERLSGND